VWITETGYEAERIGDAADEERQADYARRVMDAQLERGWWTNTFFYEAVDCVPFLPSCTIDGFGITRAHRTGGLSWPGDYRAKPAFTAIQAYIAAHPGLPGVASTTPAPDAGVPEPEMRDAGLEDAAPPSMSDAAAPPLGDSQVTLGDGGFTSRPLSSGCSTTRTTSGTPGGLLWLMATLFIVRRRSLAD
jgi:hypothetical protein